MTKAEEVFGLSISNYAGFNAVVRAVEKRCNVSIDAHNASKYRWTLLEEARVARPQILDLYEMAEIVGEILGTVFEKDQLDAYQDYLDTLTP